MTDLTTPESGVQDGRRLALFRVCPEIFVSLGCGKFEVIAQPLPDDVKLVGAFYDEGRHAFTVVVESQCFAPVADGEPLPEIEKAPVIRRVTGDE